MPDKTILTAMRRMLAMTDADPSFILPHSIENYGGTSRTECRWYPFNDQENEAKIGASVRRAVGGTWRKEVNSNYLYMRYEDENTRYVIVLDRPQVCRKVITGTQIVTETVPDPDVLATVPTVEVTKEVETFEWVCDPILGD